MSMSKSIYNLGKAYALAEKNLPDILGSEGKKTIASTAPMRSLGEIMRLLLSNHALTPQLDEQLQELLNDVDEDTPSHISIEMQGKWWAGYYSAKSPTQKGIKAMLKKSGMSQKELAESLNVTQKDVSRWATGNVAPRADKLSEISKILNCSIDDLISGNGQEENNDA